MIQKIKPGRTVFAVNYDDDNGHHAPHIVPLKIRCVGRPSTDGDPVLVVDYAKTRSWQSGVREILARHAFPTAERARDAFVAEWAKRGHEVPTPAMPAPVSS